MRAGSTARGTVIVVTLLAASGTRAAAQQRALGPEGRTVLGANAVVGAAVAGVRAAIGGKPVPKAMLLGAMGGLVHGSGKLVLPRAGLAGAGLGALGASVVANAGRGAGALDEVVLPVGPARLRVVRGRALNVAVDAYESVVLATHLMRPGMRVDWDRSGRAGTVVFRTAQPLLASGGRRAAGITTASTVTMSDRASDPQRSFNHEQVHVLQARFLEATIGRPVESALRDATPALRWLPRWIELGVVPPIVSGLERAALGTLAPLRRAREAEAEALEVLTP